MQIPFIKYVEALVACKYTIDVIYDRINSLGIPLSDIFSRDAIEEVYSVVSKTAPNYFKTPGALPESEWLRELNISKMVAHELKLQIPETTIGIEGALDIVHDTDMYLTMSSLALAKVDDEDIEMIVNAKYNIHYTAEDIQEFLHYFINVRDWGVSDKRAYVKIITDDKLKRMYDVAIAGDKDYLIWKLGIAPGRSFDQMLRDMSTDAYYLFKEKMRRSPDEAQKWGQLMLKLSDKLDKLQEESADKRSLFDQIQFTLAGKTEEDLQETVINKVGQVVKRQKGRRHIQDVLKEEERKSEPE